MVSGIGGAHVLPPCVRQPTEGAVMFQEHALHYYSKSAVIQKGAAASSQVLCICCTKQAHHRGHHLKTEAHQLLD